MTCIRRFFRFFIFILFISYKIVGGLTEIKFIEDYYPPLNNFDNVYNAPINQKVTRPIIAHIYNDGIEVTEGSDSIAKILIKTVMEVENSSGLQPPADIDDWLVNKYGNLCWQSNEAADYPQRVQMFGVKIRCGENGTLDTKAIGGKIIFDEYYHYQKDFNYPIHKRRFQITALTSQGNITILTNPFYVTNAAWKLTWIMKPPLSIQSDVAFDIKVQIQDKDGRLLTKGLDANLYLLLTVAWDSKIFQISQLSIPVLVSTQETLAGIGVYKDVNSKDLVRLERAKNGTHTFNGIRLLERNEAGVKLNITMLRSHGRTERTPSIYAEVDYVNRMSNRRLTIFSNFTPPLSTPGLLLSDRIRVVEKVGVELVLVNFESIRRKVAANFRLYELPVLELRDEFGGRIWTGKDSVLDVLLKADRPACISTDGAFRLVDGRGIFKGSICQPIPVVRLTFQVTNSKGVLIVSKDVIEMEVSNDLKIAQFISLEGPNLLTFLTSSLTNTFTKYAIEDVNDGLYYADIFKHRRLSMTTIDYQPNNLKYILDEYTKLKQLSRSDPTQSLAAIIGFNSNEFTERMMPLLKQDEILQMALTEDYSVFSDKTFYPFFNRVVYSESLQINNFLLALKDRSWMRFLIVRDKNLLPSSEFYSRLGQLGLAVDEEILISGVDFSRNDYDMLRSSMERIKKASTRIIYLYANPPLSYYIIRAAIDFGVGGIHGYQWLMNGDMAKNFPLLGEHELCRIKPDCVRGMQGIYLFLNTYLGPFQNIYKL